MEVPTVQEGISLPCLQPLRKCSGSRPLPVMPYDCLGLRFQPVSRRTNHVCAVEHRFQRACGDAVVAQRSAHAGRAHTGPGEDACGQPIYRRQRREHHCRQCSRAAGHRDRLARTCPHRCPSDARSGNDRRGLSGAALVRSPMTGGSDQAEGFALGECLLLRITRALDDATVDEVTPGDVGTICGVLRRPTKQRWSSA